MLPLHSRCAKLTHGTRTYQSWDKLRLGEAYTQVAKMQEQGIKMTTCCFEEATYPSVKLADSQCQEREFIDRVLDSFVAT